MLTTIVDPVARLKVEGDRDWVAPTSAGVNAGVLCAGAARVGAASLVLSLARVVATSAVRRVRKNVGHGHGVKGL